MTQYFALESVVFMMAFVFVFDTLHQRNLTYRRLWRMYDELKSLGQLR